MERFARICCAAKYKTNKGCGGIIGYLSRDEKMIWYVEANPPYLIDSDPRVLIRAGARPDKAIAPLVCPRCGKLAILRAGRAAEAIERAEATGKLVRLTVIPASSDPAGIAATT